MGRQVVVRRRKVVDQVVHFHRHHHQDCHCHHHQGVEEQEQEEVMELGACSISWMRMDQELVLDWTEVQR